MFTFVMFVVNPVSDSKLLVSGTSSYSYLYNSVLKKKIHGAICNKNNCFCVLRNKGMNIQFKMRGLKRHRAIRFITREKVGINCDNLNT